MLYPRGRNTIVPLRSLLKGAIERPECTASPLGGVLSTIRYYRTILMSDRWVFRHSIAMVHILFHGISWTLNQDVTEQSTSKTHFAPENTRYLRVFLTPFPENYVFRVVYELENMEDPLYRIITSIEKVRPSAVPIHRPVTYDWRSSKWETTTAPYFG